MSESSKITNADAHFVIAAIMRVNDARHADNATGRSFVPDRTNAAIDKLLEVGNYILDLMQQP